MTPPMPMGVVGAAGGTSGGDLVLPLVAVGTAVALAGYASLRRGLRARTRTTPGGRTPTVVPLDELDRRAGDSLVAIDDCVRTSREELSYVTARWGEEAVHAHVAAVEFAAAELAAAFRARHQLDEGAGARRELLEEIVARCDAAGRRLDAEAPGFDGTRALERAAREAVEYAETRFRRRAARAVDTDGVLAELRERCALAAYLPVAGHDEQAKDRLVFATTCLNGARRALDRDEIEHAVARLRAAEAAVDQAGVLTDGIARLATELATATRKLPAALAATARDLAEARALLDTQGARADLRGRIAYGESVVEALRAEAPAAARGWRDPVGALRRIEHVSTGLDRALARTPDGSRALARLERALLTARSTVAAAADHVTAYRGAVGVEARTRLAEAERRLREAENTERPPVPAPSAALADAREADTQARQARQLAERDVRTYGTPYGESLETGGAVLGGILLRARPGRDTGGPASYGGPGTRGRRNCGELFHTPRHPPGEGTG
ncbi:TPM domain-containing protein [Streptomyces sp. RY43-2]|uniref:TPM domain-containing protein n=1 Tax=Streptomyces macrolidinus TaxID=2952607 RepID=A0ABT0ZHF7_9ACTN|nr:TPM domain-containing protein [Streptomyces macrolidinus]MCN9243027.1 TPM domain-containing protein [Streptomyces macrolidinus]